MIITQKHKFDRLDEEGGFVFAFVEKELYYKIPNIQKGQSYQPKISILQLTVLFLLVKIIRFRLKGEWHTHPSGNLHPSDADIENAIKNKKTFEYHTWKLHIRSTDGQETNKMTLHYEER